MILFGRRGPYRRSESTRNAIVEAVKAQPGASRSDLLRLTGLSWGAVAHHVMRLVERGEIRTHRVGGRTYFFAEGVEPNMLPFLRLLRTEPPATEILRVLNRNGPASIQKLSRELALDRKTVRRHVVAMVDAGLVGLTRHGRPRFELRSLPLDAQGLFGAGATAGHGQVAPGPQPPAP